MKSSYISPQLNVLNDLNKFISETAKCRKVNHAVSHMEARESIIQQLGWRNAHGYSTWRQKEVEHAKRLENCPKRKACLIKKELADDAAVYIYKIDVEVYFIDEEGIAYGLEELSDILETESDITLQPFFRLTRPKAECSIWIAEGPCKAIEGFEWRKPDCSCRKNYTYEMREHFEEYRESYLLTTRDDLISWATKWGGVACFERELLDTLEQEHPIRKSLTRPYLSRTWQYFIQS